MSNDPYTELECIWRQYTSGAIPDLQPSILALLAQHGIRPRQDDGELKQITVSKPITAPEHLLVGLRYLKRDGTHTEDKFVFGKDGTVRRDYKQQIEHEWPEYKGAHKQQLIFTLVVDQDIRLTSTNTITSVNLRLA